MMSALRIPYMHLRAHFESRSSVSIGISQNESRRNDSYQQYALLLKSTGGELEFGLLIYMQQVLVEMFIRYHYDSMLFDHFEFSNSE